MFGWFRKKEKADSQRSVAEARKALSVTVNELQESKELRAEAAQTRQEFKERAVTLREIRLRNHITPSIFPPQGRTTP